MKHIEISYKISYESYEISATENFTLSNKVSDHISAYFSLDLS